MFGNTEQVARVIAKVLNNNTVLLKVDQFKMADLEGIDLLVVGSPTHGGRPSEAIKKFLASLPLDSLKDIKCASFDTGISSTGQNIFLKMVINIFGYAAIHIDRALQDRGGIVVAEPRVFFVKDKKGPMNEGELDKVVEWTKGILDKIN